VTKVESLNPNGADAEAAVKRLFPGAGPEAKAEFDALLLPLGGDQLKQTARQIKAAGAGAEKVQLLGSGLWDDASTTGEHSCVFICSTRLTKATHSFGRCWTMFSICLARGST